jgi:hypothetical protein
MPPNPAPLGQVSYSMPMPQYMGYGYGYAPVQPVGYYQPMYAPQYPSGYGMGYQGQAPGYWYGN